MRIVVSSNNDEPPVSGLCRDLEHIFGGLAQPELERLAIDAIREYRASVALAETTRSELIAADVDLFPQRRAELQRVHQQAEAAHRVHQLVLNNLIDRLGYVPKIPAGKLT